MKSGEGLQVVDMSIVADSWGISTWLKVAAVHNMKKFSEEHMEGDTLFDIFQMLGVDDVVTAPREDTVRRLREERERRERRNGHEQPFRDPAAQPDPEGA